MDSGGQSIVSHKFPHRSRTGPPSSDSVDGKTVIPAQSRFASILFRPIPNFEQGAKNRGSCKRPLLLSSGESSPLVI